MRIYTRTGDGGETSLFNGDRVHKDDARIEAYGTLDELNAIVGGLLDHEALAPHADRLHAIQDHLFRIGVFADPEGPRPGALTTGQGDIEGLEQWIDAMEEPLEPCGTSSCRADIPHSRPATSPARSRAARNAGPWPSTGSWASPRRPCSTSTGSAMPSSRLAGGRPTRPEPSRSSGPSTPNDLISRTLSRTFCGCGP